MSLYRLIYYSTMIGGWMAFLGWLISEFMLSYGKNDTGFVAVVLTCALVGAAIGAGLNLVAGAANALWMQQIRRILPGFLVGGIGGALGGIIGDLLFVHLGVPRAFGWMIMGAAIGVSEGLYSRSSAKIRNGLIGGSIGGLLGGFLFGPIFSLIGSETGMSSRATAFVILGMCIGALISLVQVVMKEAWLTVLDGYRPGRQMILGDGQITLGKAEYSHLPFLGMGDALLEPEHAMIIREKNGRFAIEDKNSRLGTTVNNVPVHGRTFLSDGDVIHLASNAIRFEERDTRQKDSNPSTTEPYSPPVFTPPPPIKPSQPPVSPPPPLHSKPASPPQSLPAAATKPPAGGCPSCGRAIPGNQRYCIVCDLHF